MNKQKKKERKSKDVEENKNGKKKKKNVWGIGRVNVIWKKKLKIERIKTINR